MSLPTAPLVSVVIPFLDAGDFLDEAVCSVQQQTHPNWELLLVDDGTTDGSADVARTHAARDERVQYLHHENHANRGISASRNLGLSRAKGEYVAMLDADDVYLPEKLERQVAMLEQHPAAAMVYGRSEYWYGWTGDPAHAAQDRVQEHGIAGDVLMHPPQLVAMHIDGRAAVPCPSGILVRREAAIAAGGFEESFTGMYEDQVFFAKICLRFPVYLSQACLERYRQHPASICSMTERVGDLLAARRRFLDWLSGELERRVPNDRGLWQSLRQEIWMARDRTPLPARLHTKARFLEKWMLRIESSFLSATLRERLWDRRVPSLAPHCKLQAAREGSRRAG